MGERPDYDQALLSQWIAFKAFRGELVPQDPRDEPASERLKRIRTARKANAASTKAKKKATRRRIEKAEV